MTKIYSILLLIGGMITQASAQTNAVTLTPPVGPATQHTSITAAYAAIPTTPAGNYLIEINAVYDGSAETYPITLTDKGIVAVSPTITIRPAAGNNGETIQRAVPAAGAVILIDGGDNIIIDGRPGGVVSTPTNYLSVVDLFSGDNLSRNIELINNADGNTIRFINAIAAAGTAAAGSRVLAISTSPAGQGNDNNTITNNIVAGGYRGIQVFGSVANNTGNVISNNIVTNFTSVGINAGSFQENTTIQSNTLTYNSFNPLATAVTGIQNLGTGTGLIEGNTISGLTSAVTTQIIGIYLPAAAAANTITVRKNKIYDFTSSAAVNIWGIYVSGFTGSTYNIDNNFVSFTQPNSSANSVNGIQFAGTAATNSYTSNVYYNSVRIGGTHTGGTASSIVSVGIMRTNDQAGSVYNQKNNIAINERSGGTAGVFHVGFMNFSTIGTFSVDYNNYFATAASGAMAAGWGTSVFAPTPAGLTAYKAAATPNEQNTTFSNVTFVSNTDLHLSGASETDPALKGTLVATVLTDIDNQTRHALEPRKGADEVNRPYPVTMLNFTGVNRGSYNQLEWATATETNNNGFELQRSLNGVEFNALTFVKSKAVNGSSASRLDYSFSDTRPYSVNSYYRLKQVDIDGKVSYSNIVVVKGNGINSLQVTNLYPNPVRDNLNVVIGAQASARVTLSVMDISGKVMMQKIVEVNAGDNIISLNAASFAPGSYVLSISNSLTGETFTTRFIK